MMKTLLLIFPFIFLAEEIVAQPVDWVKEYFVPGYHAKQITGLTSDGAGSVYVSAKGDGYSSGPWFSAFYKLNSDGDQLHADTAAADVWNALQLADGYIYSMGTELIKRDLNGNILQDQNLIWSTSPSFAEKKDAVILGNHVYAIVYSDLIKYDLSGNEIWNQSVAGGSTSHTQVFALDAHIFVLSYSYVFFSYRILKYDTLGNFVWNKPMIGSVTNIYSDGNNYFYGFSQMGEVNKLDVNGELVWNKFVDSTYFTNGYVYNDTVYACGGVVPAGGGGAGDEERLGVLVRLSDLTGDVHSTRTFDFFSGLCSDEQLTTVHVDNDAIYLGGFYCGEGHNIFLAKLDHDSGLTALATQEPQENEISVYPNPGTGIFTVNFNSRAEETVICIHDILGNCVLSRTSLKDSIQEIDLSACSKGVYFLEISEGEKITVKKIVLN